MAAGLPLFPLLHSGISSPYIQAKLYCAVLSPNYALFGDRKYFQIITCFRIDDEKVRPIFLSKTRNPDYPPGAGAIERPHRDVRAGGRFPRLVTEEDNMQENLDEFIYMPLMTVSEAAKYMGVGKKIIYQLIEFDEIRAVRDRGATMVEKRSLDAFRASGKLT